MMVEFLLVEMLAIIVKIKVMALELQKTIMQHKVISIETKLVLVHKIMVNCFQIILTGLQIEVAIGHHE